MPKTVYLANPYGFSAQQKALLLPPIVAALENLGLEVWEPFARNNQIDFMEQGWAYRVGQRDFSDVVDSDATFAIVNGVPPDEGVMVELGMAIALKKPTFPLSGRLSPRYRQRALSPEPDAVHRAAGGWLGGLLLHVGGGDNGAGQSFGSMGREQMISGRQTQAPDVNYAHNSLPPTGANSAGLDCRRLSP